MNKKNILWRFCVVIPFRAQPAGTEVIDVDRFWTAAKNC